MKKSTFQRCVTSIVTTMLLMLGFAQSANAGVITTQEVLSAQDHHAAVSSIESRLAEASVAKQLQAMGVDTDVLSSRISQLTTAEIQELNQRLEAHEAGAGVVGIVGAVFIVLLVLELVGVIDIFKKI